MKKGIVFLSALMMAFTVLLVPVEVKASELTATDVKHMAFSAGLQNFVVGGPYFADDTWVVIEKPYRLSGHYHGSSKYKVIDGVLEPWSYQGVTTAWLPLKYSTHDIEDRETGTVFFSASLDPIPKALREVVPSLLAQTLKILPVAVMILAGMMGVSLISRVLYRYL